MIGRFTPNKSDLPDTARVSKTAVLECNGDWVWALDDAFMVYLAYLAESLAVGPASDQEWVQELVSSLEGSATISDQAMDLKAESLQQRGVLREAAESARCEAQARGDVSTETLQGWVMGNGLPVSDGYSRTGECVELARVLEVADAVLAMLDGTLPTRPEYHRWWVGTGRGLVAIEMTVP